KVVTSSNVFALTPTAGGMGCEPDDGSLLGTELDVLAWSELTGTGDLFLDYFNNPNGDFANDFFSWRPSLQTPASSPTVFVVSEKSTNDGAYSPVPRAARSGARARALS